MITDVALQNLASAYTNATYTLPAYLTRGTSTVNPSTSDTTLVGEIGTRIIVTGIDGENESSFTAIIPAAGVVGTSGDDIRSMALFSGSTGGDLHSLVSIPSILHTTTYDIDVEWNIVFERR